MFAFRSLLLRSLLFPVVLSGLTAAPLAFAVAPPCQPLGTQRGLTIAVNFPANPTESKPIANVGDDYYGASNSLADYWNEVSYGQTTLTGDTLGWYTLNYPGWESCDVFDIRENALAQAAASVDLTQYNRIFIRIQSHSGCNNDNLGNSCTVIPLPGGGTIEASTSWNFTDSLGVIVHEGGHNLDLAHASSEDQGASPVGPIGSAGTLTEYGDTFDVMGQSGRLGHFNAIRKLQLGFIDASAVAEPVNSGTYTIEPLTTTGTGLKTVRIFRGAFWDTSGTLPKVGKEYLWIETRKDTGYDANIDTSGGAAASAYGGAIVRLERSFNTRSLLLDMHPGTTSPDELDAPLTQGETFTDPYTGISLKHDKVFNSTGNVKLTVTIPNPDTDRDGVDDTTETARGTNPLVEDSDGDGLSDFYEACYDNDCSTYNPGITDIDANKADTENDGIPDDWEIANGTDPLVNDSALDGDADGLTNLQEYQAGTKPDDADTDNDRLTDGDEVLLYATDPLLFLDTDLDGMSDDWENVRGTDFSVNDAYDDPDNDGVDNAVENLRDTLPLDGNSTPVIQTLYVDAANTGGDGSAQNPYSSVSTAISNALDGDTVSIASGSYNPFFVTLLKSINLLGPADRSASISASTFIQANSIWGRMTGLTLDLTGTNFFDNLRNTTLQNCHLNATQGIILSRAWTSVDHCVIAGPNDGSGAGIRFQDSGQINLINNTISGYGVGLQLSNGNPDLLSRNNILDNIDDLLDFTDTSGFSYNLISDGELSGINGNLTGVPGFVDSGNGDFHLLASSVAIDAGDPSDSFVFEPANNGGRINIGAFGNTTEASAGNDTDGDGLTDQNEWCWDGDCASYDPFDINSNPTGVDLDLAATDTDGDGWSDSDEILNLSDPLNPLSVPMITADGDLNQDGVVDVRDVLLGYRGLNGQITLSAAQLAHGDLYPVGTGDGQFTIEDLLRLSRTAFQLP